MSGSGILGSVIPLAPALIIFIRSLIGGVALWGFMRLSGDLPKVDIKKDRLFLFGNGFLLTLHWVTYFMAIKMSGVAIAMLSLFTYPVITTLLEPLFDKVRLTRLSLINSLLAMIGVSFILPDFDLENKVSAGVALGVLSALVYALRNLWNKAYIGKYKGSTIMLYQLFVAGLLLLPTIFIFPMEYSFSTFGNLLILGLVTTAAAHTLFVSALQYFTASTVSILSSLIPLYGIGWAVWLIDEPMTINIGIGGAIIVLTVVFQSFAIRRRLPNGG